MGRVRKQIDDINMALVRDYFQRKIATGELDTLLSKDVHAGLKALEKVIIADTVEQWNDWADRYLSEQGRKTLWGALRGRSYRKENPRNELTKSVADQLREVTNEDDINAAVMVLIQGKIKQKI